MTISHAHCRVKDLVGAIEWFTSKFDVQPSYVDARLAAFSFGVFTLILDAAGDNSVVTIGFSSQDCDADFAALVARDAIVVEPPRDRPYGARAAYLRGPGALTIEIEQVLLSAA